MVSSKVNPHEHHTIPRNRTPLNEWWEVTPGENFTVRASMQDMGGLCTIVEMTVASRNGVPVHTHAHEEHHFIVLAGSLQLINGNEKLTLSAGDSVTVKRGIPTPRLISPTRWFGC